MSGILEEPIQLDNVDTLIEELETQFAVVTDSIYAALPFTSECSNGCTNGCTFTCTQGCTGSPC